MLRRELILLVLGIWFTLIGCKDGHLVKETEYYASNGKIKSIRSFIDDSLESGVSLFYKESGVISDSVEYDHGKKNGWHKRFDEKARLISKTHFKNNLADGKSYIYFINGNIKSISSWSNGITYGDTFFYYENGQLKLYNCEDFSNENFYVYALDTNGEVIKNEGVVFSDNIVTNIEDNKKIHVKDILQVKIIVANPPNSITLLETSLEEVKSIPNYKPLKVSNNIALFSKSLDQTGSFYFCIRGSIRDNKNRIITKDSLCYEFQVEK